jgi:cell division GTPase FtsZ
MEQAFGCVDEVLGNAVKSVCDIMLRHAISMWISMIVRSVMENGAMLLWVPACRWG